MKKIYPSKNRKLGGYIFLILKFIFYKHPITIIVRIGSLQKGG